MKRSLVIILTCFISLQFSYAQNFGDFPVIEKTKLLNDLEILYQGLDKFHSGMYWYTTNYSVDSAFQKIRSEITKDLNVLEFHKLIAPLVALSREGHTKIYRPETVIEKLNTDIKLLPLILIFLGNELFMVKNGSDFQDFALEGKQIESINGETPIAIVKNIGSLFATDGFVETSKYSDLAGFNFSVYYFYYYGLVDQFEIKFKENTEPIIIKSLTTKNIIQNQKDRLKKLAIVEKEDLLEYKVLENSIAYLGINDFHNQNIEEHSKEKNLKSFLERSFKSIKENNIQTLIVDVSKNGGGSEGNEGLLYSYFGEDYQKYKKVKAKTQNAILDNGVDKPITLKTFGFFERTFTYKKMEDGSLERRQWLGPGLRAFKKEPKNKFTGKVYVIISPKTYSGASEFSNMMYTKDLATFVGQETGGGYLGNTSGYSQKVVLPNSKIKVAIPALQFIMNVEPKLPFGRGVIPHYKVIPTFEQYISGENASVEYILKQLENDL